MKKAFFHLIKWLFVSSFTEELAILREKSLYYIRYNANNGFTLNVRSSLYASPYEIISIEANEFGGVTYTAIHTTFNSPTSNIPVGLLPTQNLVEIAEALRTGKVSFNP